MVKDMEKGRGGTRQKGRYSICIQVTDLERIIWKVVFGAAGLVEHDAGVSPVTRKEYLALLNMGASKASSSAAAAAQFATLAPRIKNISEATIRKKWKPLPAGSQDKVRQILFNLKTKRAGASSSRRIATVGSMRQARAKRPGSNTQVREEEYEKAVEEVADRGHNQKRDYDDYKTPLPSSAHAIPSNRREQQG
ncbi:hypothetical protein KCU88_g284, partial [Aureobasidium melanogenum]